MKLKRTLLINLKKNPYLINDTVFNNFTVGVINNDKEAFDCKRSYALRKSTVKMLNELKGFSLDVNMPVGEIVDDAIRYYYYYVTNQL